nr:LLM class flavin-dependent oxidoreductase [Micromonospora sp. DSM 115978]
EPGVTFQGEYFQLDGIGLAERPQRPLDIWLGGAVPAALRRVGRLGDGWLASFVPPGRAAAGIQTINEAAAEAGRTIDHDHFGISMQVAFDGQPLPGRLAEAARRRYPDVDPAEIVPVGWPAARRLIGEYVDAGVSKFVIYPAPPPAGSWDAFLDGFV